ncbi:MAG: hypothetical protein QOF01_3593 [Thermomicrobiales bacterium]|nr:hypothetical protein [Thermomicrobiales bacterium]
MRLAVDPPRYFVTLLTRVVDACLCSAYNDAGHGLSHDYR